MNSINTYTDAHIVIDFEYVENLPECIFNQALIEKIKNIFKNLIAELHFRKPPKQFCTVKEIIPYILGFASLSLLTLVGLGAHCKVLLDGRGNSTAINSTGSDLYPGLKNADDCVFAFLLPGLMMTIGLALSFFFIGIIKTCSRIDNNRNPINRNTFLQYSKIISQIENELITSVNYNSIDKEMNTEFTFINEKISFYNKEVLLVVQIHELNSHRGMRLEEVLRDIVEDCISENNTEIKQKHIEELKNIFTWKILNLKPNKANFTDLTINYA